MPHCTLEYSRNVLDEPDFGQLLAALHERLMETGLFSLGDIKSRVIAHDVYRVGDGSEGTAFVALTIAILDGRSDEAKAALAQSLLELLEDAYPKALASQKVKLSVEVRDMHRKSYMRAHGPAA